MLLTSGRETFQVRTIRRWGSRTWAGAIREARGLSPAKQTELCQCAVSRSRRKSVRTYRHEDRIRMTMLSLATAAKWLFQSHLLTSSVASMPGKLSFSIEHPSTRPSLRRMRSRTTLQHSRPQQQDVTRLELGLLPLSTSLICSTGDREEELLQESARSAWLLPPMHQIHQHAPSRQSLRSGTTCACCSSPPCQSHQNAGRRASLRRSTSAWLGAQSD